MNDKEKETTVNDSVYAVLAREALLAMRMMLTEKEVKPKNAASRLENLMLVALVMQVAMFIMLARLLVTLTSIASHL